MLRRWWRRCRVVGWAVHACAPQRGRATSSSCGASCSTCPTHPRYVWCGAAAGTTRLQSPVMGPLERVSISKAGTPFGEQGTVMWLCKDHKLLVDKCMSPRGGAVCDGAQTCRARCRTQRWPSRRRPYRTRPRSPACNSTSATRRNHTWHRTVPYFHRPGRCTVLDGISTVPDGENTVKIR